MNAIVVVFSLSLFAIVRTGLMSFGDIESGRGGGSSRGSIPLSIGGMNNRGGSSDRGMSVSMVGGVSGSVVADDILSMNEDINAMQKMLGDLGTKRDTPELRASFKSKQQRATNVAARTRENLAALASVGGSNNTGGGYSSYQNGGDWPLQQARLTKDFENILRRLREVGQRYVSVERGVVIRARNHSEDSDGEDDGLERRALLTSSHQYQQQQHLQRLEETIGYNEALIVEREEGIKEIETSLLAVNEIFRDLAVITAEQGQIVDTIETNIFSAEAQTGEALKEARKARASQQSSQKKCIILVVIVGILLIIIAFSIYSSLKG